MTKITLSEVSGKEHNKDKKDISKKKISMGV